MLPTNSQEEDVISDLGAFAGLKGPLWRNFRGIFQLYNQPSHVGFTEIFGPLPTSMGCGLCQLFPDSNIPIMLAVVTIELVPHNVGQEVLMDNDFDDVEVNIMRNFF